MCLFVNNSWCAMSNIKEAYRYFSPEVEYLMISCRPHNLPREFSSILFVAIYLAPQTDSGTKTALNQLYKPISKQEKSHSEVALLEAENFNAGKLKSVLPPCHMCNQREKNYKPPLFHTQRCIQRSPLTSIW